MQTSLHQANITVLYAAQRQRHSDEICGSVYLEMISLEKAALLVEMIENGRVDGNKFLQTSHSTKTVHGLSRLRKDRCEFSARLFFQLPASCLATFPITIIAAP